MRSKKRISKTKKILLGGAVIICTIVVLVIAGRDNSVPVPHRNPIDAKLSQYSDTHITPNAVTTDPQFKNIAFEPVPPSERPFLSSQIAALARVLRLFTRTPSAQKEYGSWIWTPVLSMTPQYMESMLAGAKADEVNVIYVSIDSYLDVFVMPKGPDREKQRKIFSDTLEDFITRANAKGIAVDAEGGWRNWAEGDNIYKALAVVSYAKNFNDTHASKFRGFQYDVEPYLLDSYQKNKAGVLGNFVSLVDKTQYFLGTSTLKFSVVVPDFWDGKDALTPQFSYDGKDGYVFGHLLSVLDKRPASSIIIMSYRNFAESDDGSIGISKNEMQTANDGAYNTKIIIAQETGDVPPPYITFHNTSKKYLGTQLDKINKAFNSYPNFGGIAVHYVNAFLALK